MDFLPPIVALPSELLRYIFSICCQDRITIQCGHHRLRPFGAISSIPMPMVLSRVSSQWRQLATSCPVLWSCLRFEIGAASRVEEDDRRESETCYRITQYFLHLASGAPLNLSFEDMPIPMERTYIMFDLTMDALCRQAKQWATAKFCVDDSFFIRHSLSLELLRGKLENLFRFYLSKTSTGSVSIRSWTTYLLDPVPCPSLRRVDIEWLEAAPLESNILPTLLPWGQLESLFLRLRFFAPSILEIVPLCPHLKHLSIGIFSLWEYDGDSRQHLKHSTSWNLDSLSIKIDFMNPNGTTRDFWENLTAPHLTSLDLCTGRIPPTSPFSKEREPYLLRFIRSSSFTLTSFSLRRTGFSAEQSVRMLQLLPRLVNLLIIEHETPQDENTICQSYFFNHFLVDPADPRPPFLPRLKTYHIEVNSKSLDDKGFVEAMRSRWIPDPEICVRMGVDSLQTIEVTFLDKPMVVPESFMRLKELTREGLRVLVS